MGGGAEPLAIELPLTRVTRKKRKIQIFRMELVTYLRAGGKTNIVYTVVRVDGIRAVLLMLKLQVGPTFWKAVQNHSIHL